MKLRDLSSTNPQRKRDIETALRQTLALIPADAWWSTTQVTDHIFPRWEIGTAEERSARAYLCGHVVALGKSLGLNSRAGEPRPGKGRMTGKTIQPREWTYLPPREQAAPPPDWRTEIERRVAAIEAKLSISVSDLI